MTILVIDTSVAVKWLNQDNEENIEKADKVLQDVKEGIVELIAPELLKYEVGNALLFGKKIAAQDIEDLLDIFYSIPLTFVALDINSAITTYNLAKTLGITYYDASFMTLAKQYEAILVTENIKHQGKSADVAVKSLAKY